MSKKSMDRCLEEVFKDMEIRKKIDYGNMCSVRQCNRANDRIRKNFLYIDKNYPDQIHLVEELLYHSDPEVVSYVAVVIQDFVNATVEQKWKAIDVVKELLRNESLHWTSAIFLSRVWLRKAEAKLLDQQCQRDGLGAEEKNQEDV